MAEIAAVCASLSGKASRCVDDEGVGVDDSEATAASA